MLSIQLQKHIEQLLLELQTASPFFESLAAISNHSESFLTHLTGIAEGGNKLHESANHLHALFSRTQRVTAEIDQRKFYSTLEKLHTFLRQLPTVFIPPLGNKELQFFATLLTRV